MGYAKFSFGCGYRSKLAVSLGPHSGRRGEAVIDAGLQAVLAGAGRAGTGFVQFDHAGQFQEADPQVAVHVRGVRRQLRHDQGIRLRGDLHRGFPGAERHQAESCLSPAAPNATIQSSPVSGLSAVQDQGVRTIATKRDGRHWARGDRP